METKGKIRNRIILATSTLFIIIIIIAGFCVYFLVDEDQSKIILLVFLVCIIVLGICILIYLEQERRKSLQRRETGINNHFVEESFEVQHIRPEPTAPPMSERSSWALLPRKWSTGTRLPSYSHCQSHISTCFAENKMDVNKLLTRPADEFGNDESLEEMWAAKAFEHAEVYFNLLCSVDAKLLNLTPMDKTVYTIFREEFPSLDVKIINEDNMKNPTGKIKWRMFCERFKDVVEDYNYGTLLRTDCSSDYNQDNSILVPRVQFLAIELARNKEGYNDIVRYKFKQPKKEEPLS